MAKKRGGAARSKKRTASSRAGEAKKNLQLIKDFLKENERILWIRSSVIRSRAAPHTKQKHVVARLSPSTATGHARAEPALMPVRPREFVAWLLLALLLVHDFIQQQRHIDAWSHTKQAEREARHAEAEQAAQRRTSATDEYFGRSVRRLGAGSDKFEDVSAAYTLHEPAQELQSLLGTNATFNRSWLVSPWLTPTGCSARAARDSARQRGPHRRAPDALCSFLLFPLLHRWCVKQATWVQRHAHTRQTCGLCAGLQTWAR